MTELFKDPNPRPNSEQTSGGLVEVGYTVPETIAPETEVIDQSRLSRLTHALGDLRAMMRETDPADIVRNFNQL
jgi:hypothetical protein